MSPPATSVADSIHKLEKLQTELGRLLPHEAFYLEHQHYITESQTRQTLLQYFARTCKHFSRYGSSADPEIGTKIEQAFKALTDNSKHFSCDSLLSRPPHGTYTVQDTRKRNLFDQDKEAENLFQLTDHGGTTRKIRAR